MITGKEVQDLLNTGIDIGYKSCIAESIDALGSILPYVGIEPEVQDVIMDRFRNKVKEQTTETWHGYHNDLEMPKGTFDQIFNDCEENDDDV